MNHSRGNTLGKLTFMLLIIPTLLFSVWVSALDTQGETPTENHWVCPMHPQIIKSDEGSCPICGMDLVKKKSKPLAAKNQTADKVVDHYTCPMHPQIKRDAEGSCPICGMDLVPVYKQSGHLNDEGDVRISAAVENNLGVKTAYVESAPLPQLIETVGYVQFNEDTLKHVHTRVEGWIEKLNVDSVGDSVKAGQTLFEIYAPQLVSAQQEYLIAKSSRNQQLINASRQRLNLLGVTKLQIAALDKSGKASERLSVIAERGGYVSQLNVRQGMFVKPATEIMVLGELVDVWVIAEVFERQSAWLRVGQKVTMRTDSYPARNWRGHVEYIYPVLNSQSRTLEVRIRFENSDRILKPNMYTNITVHVGDGQNRLSIPRSALIRGGRNDRVVKALGEGRYRSVMIAAGYESGDRIEVLSGLSEGDKVVTSAQFMIDSESNLNADMSRMESTPSKTNTTAHQH